MPVMTSTHQQQTPAGGRACSGPMAGRSPQAGGLAVTFKHPCGGPAMARCLRWAAAGAALAVLTGCASFSIDSGFATVEQAAQSRLGRDLRWARTDDDRAVVDQRVATLLAQPLTVDGAVQLALLNKHGLQAAFFELGIREADLVQAGTLPNPGFSLARLTRGDELELERGLHFNLARLLAMPLLQDAAAKQFAQAQGVAALSVLSLAADTRKAWVLAVAAEESHRYSDQVKQAAEASAELARRMAQVGNFNKLQQAKNAKHPLIDEVDRDFCFLLNAYDIDPGSYTPRISTMLDFNLWSWNSRNFPGIDPLVVRQNDKVRICASASAT